MIGRDTELKRIDGFLDDPSARSRVLVLFGEAGIGKSTIWRTALDRAAQRGYRLVTTRPTEAEARLPFAGLTDLLADIVDEAAADLPQPQRTALDVALMRASPGNEPAEPLAVSLAVLGVLRAAAERQPLAIGIDDVPWLDESSAGVLRFALRRLDAEPVLVVAAERVLGTAPPSSFVVELPDQRVERLALLPLGTDAVDLLLRDSLGLALPPSVLRRVHGTSGGNPFYAIEIGRALQARGPSGDVADIPRPASLTGLLRRRLDDLGEDGRDVARFAAALSQPTTAVLDAVLGRDRARTGLAEARRAQVLTGEDDPIRFAHPLLAAEAYAGVDVPDRRELHRRLAAAVTEPEELARHLALGSEGPDERVAAALEAAALHALGRGAIDAAAELSEMASDRTPIEDVARYRRIAAAGRHRLMAGDASRARRLLEAALADPERPAGPARGELLLMLAIVRALLDDFAAAGTIGEEALRHAGDDVPLTIETKVQLAGVSHITGLDWDTGARHAFEAMRLAEELGDRRILAGVIGHYAIWRYVTGHGSEPELAERAMSLEPWTSHLRSLDHPLFDFANIATLEGDIARSHELVRRLLERSEGHGDYSSLPFLLAYVSMSDFATGHGEAARERIDRAERLARSTDQATALVHAAVFRVRLETLLGNADAAWSAAEDAFRLMAQTGWRIGEWIMRRDLALLELSRDDPAAALDVVAGSVDPSGPDGSERWQWARAPAIEALIGLGRHDEARRVLGDLEAYVERIGSVLFGGWAARARARLEAAEGDLVSATHSAERAEAIHRRMGDRWELARTLFVSGDVHRRARRRARARAALSEALEGFEFLGARLWARQARQHLDRIGASREDGQGLTPTQREVAELVASGLTNRQVAERLFMSVHTVEAHLSAIYRVLEIRSRVEIEAALGRLDGGLRDSTPEFRDSPDPAGAQK